MSTALDDGDTVAFIPQVAGGSGAYHQLTDQPLDIDDVLSAVDDPSHGGTVLFVGKVREENNGHHIEHLFYEGYPAMVHRTLEDIITHCEKLGVGVRVAVAHRVGDLQVGDIAVVVAAAAPHRSEAFEAARTCIELLKSQTPIWKKEYSPDGAEWIGSRP